MNVEEELWRIFTFYSLHYDANYPEMWKVTPFIRFAKDCQITSPKFMVSELELEIVRLVRNKRKHLNIRGVNGKDFDSAHTIVITFPDFLKLLETIALRIYPATGGVADPAASLRRLLLENVLLLACRRPAHVEHLVGALDTAAKATVRETYGKALMGVFKYYVDMADKRRSQELAAEAVKMGVTGVGNYLQSDAEAKKTRQAREKLRAQKDLISFREYGQFCHDFSLKSTALLTAIEVGDVFLNVVDYDKGTKQIRGMAFGSFCDAIVAMAMLAYRNSPEGVSSKNKAKALLHFMWRGVNQADKSKKAAQQAKTLSSVQHAGSLNQYGSGAFCDFFIKQWTQDGYPNYSEPPRASTPSGSQVLRRIISPDGEGSGGDSEDDDEEEEEEEGEEKEPEASAGGAAAGSGDAAGLVKGQYQEPVVLHGFLLAALFRTRPELAELVHLELRKSSVTGDMGL